MKKSLVTFQNISDGKLKPQFSWPKIVSVMVWNEVSHSGVVCDGLRASDCGSVATLGWTGWTTVTELGRGSSVSLGLGNVVTDWVAKKQWQWQAKAKQECQDPELIRDFRWLLSLYTTSIQVQNWTYLQDQIVRKDKTKAGFLVR